jgi:hypothetical protein
MSDIPYIEHLGDAFEAAAAGPARRRALHRPALVLVVAAIALLIAAIAVAHFTAGPVDLATRNVACYTAPNLGADVTVIAADGDPVAACTAAYQRMGRTVPPLVACSTDTVVAVIPGTDVSACARLSLRALPQGYAAAQAKTARLARSIETLEDKQDCIAPRTLALSVQRLLDEQNWTGWKTASLSDGTGACGTVTTLDGGGHRGIEGALDPSRRVVYVSAGAARSTLSLLYGKDGLARTLEDDSGRSCFTVAALSSLVESRVAAAGRSATVRIDAPLPNTVTFGDEREARYEAGCAILTDVAPAPDGRNIVASIPKGR